MTDQPPYHNSNSNTDDAASPERPSMPRWVKVSVTVVMILILLAVIMMLVGGNHGPGRHLPTKGQGVQQP